MENRVFVFVYGTLKEGYGNSVVTKDYRVSVMRGWVHGRLFDLGAFPALRLGFIDTVYGEIHELKNPEKAIRRMDYLEGYSPDRPDNKNLYNRRAIMVNIMDDPEKSKVKCVVYEYGEPLEDEQEHIEDGIWDPRDIWKNNNDNYGKVREVKQNGA